MREYILLARYEEEEHELQASINKAELVTKGRRLRDFHRQKGSKSKEGHDYRYRVCVVSTGECVWNSYWGD